MSVAHATPCVRPMRAADALTIVIERVAAAIAVSLATPFLIA
jgi:hypothetical protein